MTKKLSTVLLLALYTTSIYADSTAELGTLTIETATRSERKVSDVSSSVEVITQKDIQESVAKSADELVREVSGIDLKHTQGIMSTGTTNQVFMRGFGGNTESRALLLIDGIPMNDSYTGGIEWNQVPIDAIQRIEIVKGAGSALYGANAMGGVINIITKNPEKQTTQAELSYGSMNTKIGSLSTSGKQGKFGYLLSGQMAKSDGYMADVKPKDYSIKRATERENGNLKLSYDIDDTSSVSASYIYFHNQTVGVYNIEGGYNPYEQEMHNFQTKYTKYFENESDLSISIYKKISDTSYDSLLGSTIKKVNSGDIDEIGGTIQYVYPIGMHVLTSGIDLKLGYAKTQDDYITGEIVRTEGKQDYYALFIQDEIFYGDQWVFNVGGRFDYFKNHAGVGHDEVTSIDTIYPSENFNAFSPKVGLVYKATPNTSIRSSIGQAFRAPTVYDMYRDYISGTNVYAANPNLDPETVTSYEIGIDKKIFEKGMLSVTAYHSDAKDFIYSITPLDPTNTNYKEKTNVGKVKIQGVETEFNYQLTDHFKFFANYTYNKSTIEKFIADTSLEGNYLTNIPKNKGSVSLSYSNPEIVNAKVTVRYVGDRYSNDANTEAGIYDSYMLVDLKLSKEFTKNFQMTLSADDLFDKGYTEYYNSPGRVIMASVKMSF